LLPFDVLTIKACNAASEFQDKSIRAGIDELHGEDGATPNTTTLGSIACRRRAVSSPTGQQNARIVKRNVNG